MAKNSESWGRDAARQRYGSSKGDGMAAPADQAAPKAQGDTDNLQGPGYDNKTPNDWRIGGGPTQAEGKPGYVRTGPNPKGIR